MSVLASKILTNLSRGSLWNLMNKQMKILKK